MHLQNNIIVRDIEGLLFEKQRNELNVLTITDRVNGKLLIIIYCHMA